MKFVYGNIPENNDFHPEMEGWRGIKEPNPILLQIIAIPVLLIIIIIWGLILLYWSYINSINPEEFLLAINLVTVLEFLFILVISIPVHEFLHAIFHPGWGLSSETMIGLWLEKGIFYAHYNGTISRNRFIVVFIMPLFLMGIVPLILLFVSPSLFPTFAIISFCGVLLAVGDIIGAVIIVFQIPRLSMVRNKGWNSFWKESYQ
jgi:hypothetical protein